MKDQVPLRDDPGRLLSLGEAAAVLGVADMHLGADIRAGRLKTQVGSSGGRVTRLIRAGDLASLDPTVLDRYLPSLGAARKLGKVESGPGALGLGSGDLELTGALVQPSASPALEMTEAYCSDEGDDAHDPRHGELRERLTKSQRRGERLVALLEQEQERHRLELGEQRAAHARTSQSLLAHRRLQGILVIGLLISAFVLVRAWPQLPVGFSSVAVAATKQEPSDLAPLVAPASGDDSGASVPSQIEPVLAHPPNGQALGPAIADSSQAKLVTLQPAGVGSAEVTDPPGGAIRDDSLPDGLSVPEPLWLAPARDDLPPCTFHAVTGHGSELRSLIGPCAGAWSSSHQSVAGVLRLGGSAYCRHHHFFVTRLGGSVEQARELAQLAQSEGLVPPLIALRVERAGSAFLRRRIGDWLDSGFESGQAGGTEHQLEPCAEADHWTIRSWVAFRDVGGKELRKPFSMLLRLGDDVSGDRLLELVWSMAGDD